MNQLPIYEAVELPVEHIDLETKTAVLDRVIESNKRLPRFENDAIELFINGVPAGRY